MHRSLMLREKNRRAEKSLPDAMAAIDTSARCDW
jgi:hypothetical protein